MRAYLFSALFLSVLTGAPLLADQVFKSVDDEGNITYSATPLQDAAQVQAIELVPGPSEQQMQDAKARAERIQQNVDEMTERRKQREEGLRERREQARKEARQETARTEGPDDRYYGYRRGYPLYPGPILPRPPGLEPPVAVPLPTPPGGAL